MRLNKRMAHGGIKGIKAAALLVWNWWHIQQMCKSQRITLRHVTLNLLPSRISLYTASLSLLETLTKFHCETWWKSLDGGRWARLLWILWTCSLPLDAFHCCTRSDAEIPESSQRNWLSSAIKFQGHCLWPQSVQGI